MGTAEGSARPVSFPFPRPRCGWVLDRLPLLDGGELTGADRRKVERHLIGCPGCRGRREALRETLGLLHAAAAVAPASPGGASLWPALDRQIREERHAPRPSAASLALSLDGLGPWLDTLAAALRPRLRPALALGLSLSLVAGGAGLWSSRQVDDVPVSDASQVYDPAEIEPYEPFLDAPAPPPRPALPVDVPRLAQVDPDRPRLAGRADGSTALPFGYDLDHGTLMGPGARDVGLKPSY
jgi:hypothetical protein